MIQKFAGNCPQDREFCRSRPPCKRNKSRSLPSSLPPHANSATPMSALITQRMRSVTVDLRTPWLDMPRHSDVHSGHSPILRFPNTGSDYGNNIHPTLLRQDLSHGMPLPLVFAQAPGPVGWGHCSSNRVFLTSISGKPARFGSRRSLTRSTPDPEDVGLGDFGQSIQEGFYPWFNKLVLRPPVESAQYESLTFIEALVDVGITGSIGAVDGPDNARTESTIELFKTEVIDHEQAVRACLAPSRGSNRVLGALVQP